MEKVVVLVTLRNCNGSRVNAFYEGKVMQGKLQVEDKLKLLNKDFTKMKEGIVTTICLNGKIVKEADTGDLINLKFSLFDKGAFVLTNDLSLLHHECILEFDDVKELSDFVDKYLTLYFPDDFNFSGLVKIGKKIDSLKQNSQIQLELLYPFYLYIGQKVELELGDKSICGKVVKII